MGAAFCLPLSPSSCKKSSLLIPLEFANSLYVPHPITIFSIYAPSQVDDPDEDQSRKESFWSQIDNIVAEHSNSSYILQLGDINARLDQHLDAEHDFVGPNVWGKRQSLDDPLRDKAVYLLDFLQSHILLLPQTFATLSPKNWLHTRR